MSSCLMLGLEKELENVARNAASLSKSGDEFAEQEDQIADQISTMKQRLVKLMVDGKEPQASWHTFKWLSNNYLYATSSRM